MDDNRVVGSVGLINNDFISRMDLWPWLCALYIEEDYRGHNLSAQLIKQLKIECAEMRFKNLYLATDHIGFYEKMDLTIWLMVITHEEKHRVFRNKNKKTIVVM